jgi:hypothetical protein
MNNQKRRSTDHNALVGPHVSNDRLTEFATGALELDKTEHAHIVICHACSHFISDSVLGRIEREGDHAGIRKIWDKIFHRNPRK